MPDLYDLDASRRRVHRTEKAVQDQRSYIATLPQSVYREKAKANLDLLIEMQSIAEKSHLLILQILLAREAASDPEGSQA